MNRQLTRDELMRIIAQPMTRKEKLLRWAAIIRKCNIALRLYHNLEHLPDSTYGTLDAPDTAFAIAAADPIFKDAGLKSASVGDGKKFFELSRSELHEFSCDCGGRISNTDMATRLEKIAG